METKINKEYENTYTDKVIRGWWLSQTEEDRRLMVRKYFNSCGGGSSEQINTLYGIMPEEMEEIYNQNPKIQEVENKFDRDSVRNIVSELFSNYAFKERERALAYFELNY